jgi:hypothetical protein
MHMSSTGGRRRRPGRAVTLIEAVLFIAVALTLIVGGLVFYNQARTAAMTNEAVRMIRAVEAAGQQMVRTGQLKPDMGGSDYSDGHIPLSVLFDGGYLPPGYRDPENDDYVKSPNYGFSFKIDIFSMDSDRARRLRDGQIDLNDEPLSYFLAHNTVRIGGASRDHLRTLRTLFVRILPFDETGSGPASSNVLGAFALLGGNSRVAYIPARGDSLSPSEADRIMDGSRTVWLFIEL